MSIHFRSSSTSSFRSTQVLVTMVRSIFGVRKIPLDLCRCSGNGLGRSYLRAAAVCSFLTRVRAECLGARSHFVEVGIPIQDRFTLAPFPLTLRERFSSWMYSSNILVLSSTNYFSPYFRSPNASTPNERLSTQASLQERGLSQYPLRHPRQNYNL